MSFAEQLQEAFADHHPKNKWVKMSLGQLKKSPELVDELFKLLTHAYKDIGGNAKLASPAALVSGEIQIFQAVDIDDDPEADAAIFSKKRAGGVKGVAIGHDGTSAAKGAALKQMGKDLKVSGHYAEVSGAMAHILARKGGVPSVNDEAKVRKILKGKDIEWIGAREGWPKNPGWFRRKIGGTTLTKLIVGLPIGR